MFPRTSDRVNAPSTLPAENKGHAYYLQANIILFEIDRVVIAVTQFAKMHTRLRSALKGGHSSRDRLCKVE